eukprot:scaffold516_cov401-Prasinococcus_capsulatus_cf.AAC.27
MGLGYSCRSVQAGSTAGLATTAAMRRSSSHLLRRLHTWATRYGTQPLPSAHNLSPVLSKPDRSHTTDVGPHTTASPTSCRVRTGARNFSATKEDSIDSVRAR